MVSFTQVFHQNQIFTFALPHTGHKPRPSHAFWFGHPNHVWWNVHVMKLVVKILKIEILTQIWFIECRFCAWNAHSCSRMLRCCWDVHFKLFCLELRCYVPVGCLSFHSSLMRHAYAQKRCCQTLVFWSVWMSTLHSVTSLRHKRDLPERTIHLNENSYGLFVLNLVELFWFWSFGLFGQFIEWAKCASIGGSILCILVVGRASVSV